MGGLGLLPLQSCHAPCKARSRHAPCAGHAAAVGAHGADCRNAPQQRCSPPTNAPELLIKAWQPQPCWQPPNWLRGCAAQLHSAPGAAMQQIARRGGAAPAALTADPGVVLNRRRQQRTVGRNCIFLFQRRQLRLLGKARWGATGSTGAPRSTPSALRALATASRAYITRNAPPAHRPGFQLGEFRQVLHGEPCSGAYWRLGCH